MTRYTIKSLNADLQEINAELAGTGIYLAAKSRNGYTGLDEYEDKNNTGTGGRCIRSLHCGTPRECLKAALEYEAPSPARSLAGTQKSPFAPF